MGISLVLETDLGASLPSPLYCELLERAKPSWLLGDNENPALDSFLKLLRERHPSPTEAV
jgi:hypothetical protein